MASCRPFREAPGGAHLAPSLLPPVTSPERVGCGPPSSYIVVPSFHTQQLRVEFSMWKSFSRAVVVVVLAMAVMVHFTDAAASQVSRNKINQFPHATPSPLVLRGCSSFHATVPDSSEIEAILRAMLTDRVPFWVDLIRGVAALLLPAMIVPFVLSDSTQPHTSSSPQQPPILMCSSSTR